MGTEVAGEKAVPQRRRIVGAKGTRGPWSWAYSQSLRRRRKLDSGDISGTERRLLCGNRMSEEQKNGKAAGKVARDEIITVL